MSAQAPADARLALAIGIAGAGFAGGAGAAAPPQSTPVSVPFFTRVEAAGGEAVELADVREPDSASPVVPAASRRTQRCAWSCPPSFGCPVPQELNLPASGAPFAPPRQKTSPPSQRQTSSSPRSKAPIHPPGQEPRAARPRRPPVVARPHCRRARGASPWNGTTLPPRRTP